MTICTMQVDCFLTVPPVYACTTAAPTPELELALACGPEAPALAGPNPTRLAEILRPPPTITAPEIPMAGVTAICVPAAGIPGIWAPEVCDPTACVPVADTFPVCADRGAGGGASGLKEAV